MKERSFKSNLETKNNQQPQHCRERLGRGMYEILWKKP